MTDVRVVTFNTAAGNPRIKTPQASFLALQEVGPPQRVALAQAAARPGARFALLELHRPGLGDALVIPDRYEVLGRRRGFYVVSQLVGIGDAVQGWARRRERPNWRQFGELRTWLEVRLRDRRSGRAFTVLNTHLSVDGALKLAQGRAIVRRAKQAARRGPMILAGDFNVPAGHARGRDAELAGLLSAFADMGTAVPARRENIDYVLAEGFEPVSSRIWTGDSLRLPGSPNADLVSDHYPEDDVLRFAAS